MPIDKQMLRVATIGGFVGGVVSALCPSLPTSYWMWKEREQYRWILLLAWGVVFFIIFGLIYYVMK